MLELWTTQLSGSRSLKPLHHSKVVIQGGAEIVICFKLCKLCLAIFVWTINLKCPYYGLWKVHILVLGVPNNSLTCMQAQRFLLCVTLICGDWSISFAFHKAVFVSCFVYSVTGETAFLPLQKRHLVAKNEFSFRPIRKSTDGFMQSCKVKFVKSCQFSPVCAHNKWAGNMLMFHVDVMRMRWFHLRMRKRRKSNLVWFFFYDGRKFRRQCVNVIDTTWGRIYFSTCENFGLSVQWL